VRGDADDRVQELPGYRPLVARLEVHGAWLVLTLNWLEKFGDFSVRNVRVPVEVIDAVEVIDNPYRRVLPTIDFGFAGNSAPAAKIMTLKTRAKLADGSRAAVVAYLNRPAVVVRLLPNETPWRLLVVTSTHATRTADAVRKAIAH
jgi:hypothetical protein